MGYDLTNDQWTPDTLDPFTARVVRVDADGTWVAAIGDDPSTPTGPCRGSGVAAGDVVLVVYTDHGPWIAAKDG